MKKNNLSNFILLMLAVSSTLISATVVLILILKLKEPLIVLTILTALVVFFGILSVCIVSKQQNMGNPFNPRWGWWRATILFFVAAIAIFVSNS